MRNQSEFKDRLKEILSKYHDALQSKDSKFLDEYLTYCLDRDVVASPSHFKAQNNVKSLSNTMFSVLFKVLLIVSLIVGSLLFVQHSIENTQIDAYSKDSTYWLYFFRRWAVRFGMNEFTFIKRLYDQDCMVSNPFYEGSPRQCLCGFQLKRYNLNATEKAQKAFIRKLKSNNDDPFIMKGVLKNPVSYPRLRSVVLNATEEFGSGNSFISTLERSSMSSDYRPLFYDEYEPPRHYNMGWEISFVGATYHLRQLFPKPFFVPASQEIHLSRKIFMLGSEAPNHPSMMKFESYEGAFYIQAWGTRNYTLRSDPSCDCKQDSLKFELEPGDLIYFSAARHDLYLATSKVSGYGLGYAGSLIVDVARNS